MRIRPIESRWSAVHAPAFMLVFLFFAIVPIAAQSHMPPAPSTLESEFQTAMTARDQGDLDRAESILNSLRRSHPSVFAIDESLGLIYVAQQKYADALVLLQAAVREEPSSDVAHANLGADFFKLQRNREALEEFQTAVRLNPKNSTTLQGLGELWLNMRKPERAIEAFSAALEEKPNDPDLEIDLATSMVAAGKLDKAEEILDKLPGEDASADAQVLFGQIEEEEGHFAEAERHFNSAAQLEPSEPNAWMVGVELLRHWTFDAAIAEFEAAVAKFPTSSRMKLGLGAAYFGGGKYGEAIPVFAELLDSDKNNALYAELLGMTCTAVTESEKQKCSSLVTYAEAHPRDAKVNTFAASMLLTETKNDQRMTEARHLLNNALIADPNLPDGQYQMGLLKQDQGDWTGSVSHLEIAVKKKPDFAQAHYRLALAYWRMGRKQEAQAEMELQKRYSRQEQEDLDRRLRQITTFIAEVKK